MLTVACPDRQSARDFLSLGSILSSPSNAATVPWGRFVRKQCSKSRNPTPEIQPRVPPSDGDAHSSTPPGSGKERHDNRTGSSRLVGSGKSLPSVGSSRTAAPGWRGRHLALLKAGDDAGRFWAEARTGPKSARPLWSALKAAPLKLARPMTEAARQLRRRSSDQLAGPSHGRVLAKVAIEVKHNLNRKDPRSAGHPDDETRFIKLRLASMMMVMLVHGPLRLTRSRDTGHGSQPASVC